MFLVTLACVMAAAVNKALENRAASERLGENEASARVGTPETETLVRLELRGRNNWRGVKSIQDSEPRNTYITIVWGADYPLDGGDK